MQIYMPNGYCILYMALSLLDKHKIKKQKSQTYTNIRYAGTRTKSLNKCVEITYGLTWEL